MCRWVALALVVAASRPALADGDAERPLVERWRDVPQPQQHLRLSQQITDQLAELGNVLGASMNAVSSDAVGLRFDGRRRRMRLRLGTGDGALLRFRLDSDWQFGSGKARIVARLQVGVGRHQLDVELPDMEMAPTSYRGDRGVELRIPFFERRW